MALGKFAWDGGEALGRAPRTRRALVVQPVVAWPVSWWLWAVGAAASLGLAVVLLWVSALACVYAILAPMHGSASRRDECTD
ncbi:hypothetical protein GIY23_01740 [Allosaccharopolyspora coralli]|uniref:Uncharacterized protein n=1 Tax=Allosaccharopolyspora coralli TaxID=2665642 RepID=A0A5Q3QAF0_9PSEU|nr:hypothetical protein [Allosaccharopolyspora coralli]QGK68445.1 hypothetical protein GIY23_01740 [Allosaccharopolyspora coralli]